MIRKLHNWLSQQTKAQVLTLGFSALALLFIVDVLGPAMGLSLFYYVPVCFTAWYGGRAGGLAMAVLCAIARTAAREVEGPVHAYSWVLYWNVGVRLATNCLLVWVVSVIAEANARLQTRVTQRTAELQQEVEERKKTEEQLRASEERFKQMAENIREVFWLTDPAKQQMLYISPGYELIWGRTCASLYQSPRDWLEAIHPDDRSRVQNAMLEKQAQGEYDEEYRIQRLDGTIRWVRDRAFPVRNAQGQVFRVVGIADDITERKAGEAIVREKDRHLRLVLARAPVIVFAISKAGQFTMSEGYARQGADLVSGAVVGRNVRDVLAPQPWLLERVERALRGEEFISTDEFAGQTFTTWHAPERNEKDEIIGMVGVAVNVTERFNLQRQILEISDREQSRIGQDLHDGLCQHLVGIAFAANTLEKKLAACCATEVRDAREIVAMVDDAITQARKTARGLYPVKLEAEGLAAALSDLAAGTRERHGLDCRFDYPEPVLFFSDMVAMQLYRIAQEAVLNAVKHAQPEQIVIRLTRAGDRVELCVQDDGIGIADPLPPGGGMGLHIIEYRARTIGATFRVRRRPEGGTDVACSVLEEAAPKMSESKSNVA